MPHTGSEQPQTCFCGSETNTFLLSEEMAQAAVPLDQTALSCAICLDLLIDPATLPCGHNYCMRCVQNHWDREEERQIYSCPQCRQRFDPRPVLVKNTMLADLVEQVKTRLQSRVDLCPVGPGDVVCDVCSGKRLKAVKSCLQCVASYCETHLQPHYQSAVLKKHQLVAPSDQFQDLICSKHNEVKKMFCRTDQQLLCVVCCMEQHKDHHTVSATAERAQRQTEMETRQDQVLHKIQDKETNLERLQQEVLDLRRSADEAVKHSKKSFTKLIRLIEKSRSEVEKQIRSQLKTEQARVKRLQDQLQQDITELRQTQAQMEALALTPDHYQFLLNYPPPSSAETSPRIQPQPLGSFEQMTTAVSALTDLLQLTLTDGLDNISLTLSQEQPRPQTSLPEPEPTTREDFLKYSQEITLDPNTAYTRLPLSEGNRRATYVIKNQSYPDHPDRFSCSFQVLSRESLTGRCYWEVQWRGGGVYIAVAYKDIERKGFSDECVFGYNDKSWALECHKNGYLFWFNRDKSQVSGPVSSRIGVYLDHSAGVLSFYSITQTINLLHRVHTTFTQPLHSGLKFYWDFGDTALFPKLK